MFNGWIWTAGSVGFLLGLRHALDPDHVVAVSTLASEQRGVGRSAMIGALWGLGHAAALMAAGGAILALKLNIAEAVARRLEIAIAAMLVVLGIVAIRRGLREWTMHAHRHAHQGREHIHLHLHKTADRHGAHSHHHLLGFGLRPFSVGVAHGIAGSAALAIVAVGATTSVAAGLVYIAMLGLGSAAGMMILTAMMSLPLVVLAGRYRMFRGAAQLVAGLGSVLFGFWWMGR